METLNALGLSSLEERVYETLLDNPRSTTRELTQLLQLTSAQVRRALHLLRDQGFVTETVTRPREYVAAPPEAAVEVIVLRKQEELHQIVHRREEELHQARLAAARLGERHRAGLEKVRTSDLLEILTGPQASAQRFSQFLNSVREELLIIDRPPYASYPGPQAERETEQEMLDRGVKIRAIYSAESLEIPGRLSVIQEGSAEARVLPDVTTKLVIVDRKVGLIPFNLKQFGIEDAVVVHASFLLNALTQLFESLWDKAIPLTATAEETTAAHDDGPDLMVSLWAAGLKDESVARVLGVSRRTVTRRMRELMEELEAKTRFQAGILAERKLKVDE